jgi:CBS domain-containing protein
LKLSGRDNPAMYSKETGFRLGTTHVITFISDDRVVLLRATPHDTFSYREFVSENFPIGIVTNGDVVRAISGHVELFSMRSPVQEVMSSPLVTINPNSSIRNAMETMRQEGIHRLPVVDNGTKILGIITNKDIFSAMLKNQIFASTFINDKVLVRPRPINIWQAYRLLD